MTIDIDAIRKRADAATPGPWECHPDGLVWANRLGDPVSGSTELEDAEFIAAARTAVPDLCDEVDRLRMYSDAYHQVQKVLDRALGGDIEDGAGEGIAADVALVVKQRDEARADNQRLRDGIDEIVRAAEDASALVENPTLAGTAGAYEAVKGIGSIASDLLADDGTGKLWAVHHQGSDEYHAQPSRAEAERMKAWLDGYDAARAGDPHAAFHKAVVVEWPLSAEQHAAQLAEAVAR